MRTDPFALRARFAARLVLGSLAMMAMAACSKHVRSQLVVVVDTNLIAGVDYDHVRFQVLGPTGVVQHDETRPLAAIAGTAGITVPFSFGVFPANDDPTRPVTVSAEALLGSTHVVSYQAVTSYESNHVLELDLFLERACIHDTMCTMANQQCGRGGACVSVEMSPSTLHDYNPDAGFDAAMPSDLGVDAVSERPAPGDTGVDVTPTDPNVRLIAPMSTSELGATTLMFTWHLPVALDGYVLEIATDRTFPAGGPFTIPHTFTSARSAPGVQVGVGVLHPGVWYWRVRGTLGGATMMTSNVWQFTVTPQAATAGDAGIVDAGTAQPSIVVNGFAPDFNGDGIGDAVITARPETALQGVVNVYPGSAAYGPNALPTSVNPTLIIPPAPVQYVTSLVGAAGDVNGDGYGDLLVGTHSGVSAASVVFTYLGSPTGLQTTPVTIPLNEAATSLAGIGDVNGDGYGDVAVGSSQAQGMDGLVTVYFGSSTGPVASSAQRIVGAVGSGSQLGASVSGGGDVDGDGLADFVAGAPGITFPTADGGVAQHGEVIWVRGNVAGTFGSPTIFPATAYTQPVPADGLGTSVALLGDVNGDGLSDIVAGAPSSVVLPSMQSGEVLVLLGASAPRMPTPLPQMVTLTNGVNFGLSLASAGDFNADGFADFFAGNSTIYTTNVYGGCANITTATPTDLVHWYSEGGASVGAVAAYLGDVNRDGFSDVLAGTLDPNGGAAFLFGTAMPVPTSYAGTPVPSTQFPSMASFGASVASRACTTPSRL